MPWEYTVLKDEQFPLEHCPKCGSIFLAFLRGSVMSWWRKLLGLPYCCLICANCKEIVGYEKPLIPEPRCSDCGHRFSSHYPDPETDYCMRMGCECRGFVTRAQPEVAGEGKP